MNPKEIEKIVALAVADALKNVKTSDVKVSKKTGKKSVKPTGKKIPEISSKEIPKLINKMSKTELKTVFGTDIGHNKETPYKCGVKEFIRKYNIVSGNSYPVYLKYENKHLIIKKLGYKNSKQICTDFLNEKLKNPKNKFVEQALENELKRWE